jgi:hypothetical protein
MSKMDNLRAMREARYEQAAARAGKAATRTSMPQATTAKTTALPRPAVSASPATDDVAEPEAALCGHRAISGRTCTREAGHAAKSHRYS